MPNNSGTNQETSNASPELSSISDIQNPSITRPLGLGVDSKIKSKIWANEFWDFCTLLGLKNKEKSFEIMEIRKGNVKSKPRDQLMRKGKLASGSRLCFCRRFYRKIPSGSPCFDEIWG